jgi:hypothetical protein
MSASPAANTADRLPAQIYYQLVHTLRATLPPPVTDSPEDIARRDYFAIARVAALHPATPVEADHAALQVAAVEQSKECMRLAEKPETPFVWAVKCRAQAIAMMRQAEVALRTLKRLRLEREAVESSNVRERFAQAERDTLSRMTEALSPPPSSRRLPSHPPRRPRRRSRTASPRRSPNPLPSPSPSRPHPSSVPTAPPQLVPCVRNCWEPPPSAPQPPR